MAAGTLPLEICTRIVHHMHPSDMPPLCRVNKGFQRVAERKLYSTLYLYDAQLAYRASLAIIANDGARGHYVKRLYFYQDPRRSSSRVPIPGQFWQTFQYALSTMTELRELLVNDPTGASTWILDPTKLKFQLHVAKLHLFWDEDMVAFLQTQSQLRHLQTMDIPESSQILPLSTECLPALEYFDGPLLVAAEVLSCPNLTHIRTTVDDGLFELIPQFVESAVISGTPLRSLHVNIIPEPFLRTTLDALTSDPKWCGRMRHLGIIVMPWGDRSGIHRHLAKLHNLYSLAFDVSFLESAPLELMHRAFAMEMHIYCPSLRRVAFWLGHHHVYPWVYHHEKWICNGVLTPGQVEEQIWLSV
ncbi:hypothetical protein EIP91_002124 [Steccherinum ochraceum]|uniref:F-box domain-containing protein n=1 Tax=Steccherinum ochraceum TaxID=92696 RepID=A0A4R0REY4_9APHY|nr:hypothetical protein EIP91_002124 [Steccherinum ochraceum]